MPRRSAKANIATVLARLHEAYPAATTALAYHNPFELLVSTILSAQCTDERVNKVTPALFARFADAAALAKAEPDKLEEMIRTTGFYHNKAKSLLGMARALVEKHGGQVPASMQELVELPGVARKTANVVLGTAFGISAGIVVDTHVTRLSGRLGLTHETDPVRIERDLMALVPQSEWIALGHLLILHGRAICQARRPACARCVLKDLCPSAANFLAAEATKKRSEGRGHSRS